MKILQKATILLLIGSMAGGIAPGTAVASGTMEQVVPFSASVERSQNKLVTLPTGAMVTGATTDNGSVSIVKSGSQYQVSVSGGNSTGSVYNPYKFSQYATESRTSSSTSFVNSIAYNSEGYTGTLYKNGGVYQSSGSYTPADSQYVTAQTSSYYNSGGYSGSLSSYVYSGSYTPEASQYISSYLGLSDSGYCDTRMGDNWQRCKDALNYPSQVYYSSGGYSGNLSYFNYEYWQSPNYSSGNGHLRFDWTRKWFYRGTVYKPAVDTRVYRYQGYVYRPESDTRRYTQNYAGTAYSGGYDPTYAYTVTVHYFVDTEAPTGNLTYTPNEWTKERVMIRLSDIVDVGGAGYEYVRLPNGTISTDTNVEYLVKENGDYVFELQDKSGNVGELIAEVRNIDRSMPVIHFKETSRTESEVLTNIRITEIGDIK